MKFVTLLSLASLYASSTFALDTTGCPAGPSYNYANCLKVHGNGIFNNPDGCNKCICLELGIVCTIYKCIDPYHDVKYTYNKTPSHIQGPDGDGFNGGIYASVPEPASPSSGAYSAGSGSGSGSGWGA
ncbi:hypothetical protein AX774_g5709, partial [Zancudomyces culisetae]